jgi:hypothetical protein
VAGKDNECVVKGKQFAPDPFEKQIPVSARQIPATHTAAEKNVSANNDLLFEKMKAQASGTMPRDVVNPHGRAQQVGGFVFVKHEIGRKRLNFQFKSQAAKKLPIPYHGRGVGMHCGLAAMALDYCRGIGDVVKVTMSEHQEIDPFARERRIRPLRRIEKNPASRGLVVETIGVEHASGKRFEPIHKKMVREE